MGRTYRGNEKEQLKKKYNQFRAVRKAKQIKEETFKKRGRGDGDNDSDEYGGGDLVLVD